MSLPEAILEIADDMDKAAPQTETFRNCATVLKSFAKQLRTAVKATEGLATTVATGPWAPSPQENKFLEQERKRVAVIAEDLKQQARRDEQGTHMTEVIEADGTSCLLEVPNNLPVGARVPIGSGVYIYKEDKKLHYSPEETEAFKKRAKK